MNWVRDDNFSEEQIKGLDLSIKALSKRYKFIKGWKFIENYNQWKAYLYINIIVDWSEVAKFYNKEFKPYWEESFNKGEKIESSLIDTYIFVNPSSTDSDYQSYFEKSFEETKKIERQLNSIYSSLPTEFQILKTFKSSFGSDDTSPVEIYIEHFINGN